MMDADRQSYLDRVTVQIAELSDYFDVTWMAAAQRAVSLGMITSQDLQDIQDLALQERVAARLAQP